MYEDNAYDDAESSVSTPKTDENEYQNISSMKMSPSNETDLRRTRPATSRLTLCLWVTVMVAAIFITVSGIVTVVYTVKDHRYTPDIHCECNNRDAEARLDVFFKTIANMTDKVTALHDVITDLQSNQDMTSQTMTSQTKSIANMTDKMTALHDVITDLQSNQDMTSQTMTSQTKSIANMTDRVTALHDVITDLQSNRYMTYCSESGCETYHVTSANVLCFKMVAHPPLSWSNAQTACENMGGRLAEPSDGHSLAYLKENVHKGQASHTWLGASDRRVEGTWQWETSGDPVGSSNWGTGQPDNGSGTEHCLEMMSDGSFNDDQCYNIWAYICQKEGPDCHGWMKEEV